jgi:hypothetical protein
MNTLVRQKLIEIAKQRKTIQYQKLSDVCNLGLSMQDEPQDRLEIGRIVGEISEYEFENNRPLLSAVVVSDLANGPGNGFYELSENLGQYSGSRDINKRYEFWINELNKVYEQWG